MRFSDYSRDRGALAGLAMATLSLAVAGRSASAQDPTKLPAVVSTADRSRAMRGVVRDTGQFTVDGVEISIPVLKRRTVTRADGSFRFDGIDRGEYEVRARKIGYGPQIITIKVDSLGGDGDFALLPMARALPPMTTTSTQLGLRGVVADTSFATVPEALVKVMGADFITQTDSAGAFFMPVPTGRYVVTITKAGFADRIVSVTIPSDSGRRITAYLQPSTGTRPVKEAWNIPDLNFRMAWRTSRQSMFFTHEDLEKLGIEWIHDAVRMATAPFGMTEQADPRCAVVVDGGPNTAKLSTLTIDDVESVEIYDANRRVGEPIVDAGTGVRIGPAGAAQSRPSVTYSNADRAASMNQGKVCPTVYVWMR